jgi:hypothetical protein
MRGADAEEARTRHDCGGELGQVGTQFDGTSTSPSVATVGLYTELREQLASPTLIRRTDAERATRNFLS